MSFKCCRYCVPPKRNPYCHGSCPEYLKEKAEHEAKKEADYAKRKIRGDLITQRNAAVNKAFKRWRKN